MHRIVSLAPSATATIQALDAGDRLVGVTDHSDGLDVPSVGGWLTPDLERVASLDPDLVVTSDALQASIRDDLAGLATVFHYEPATLADVLAAFADLGDAIGRPDAGERLTEAARQHVARIETATPDAPADRPVVYCEEWHDPPMAAGNWVPDAVRVAGGQYPFLDAGERSTAVDAATVAAADPDQIVVHHCGRGTAADPDFAARGWDVTDAVRVLDDSLLNQPSPQLLTGIATLARTLHGDAVDGLPAGFDPAGVGV